jgi:hypothetical protein
MIRKPSLAWIAPHYGPVETEVHRNHMAAISNASRTFDVKHVGISDKMYLHSASNVLASEALKSGADYIFWCEMDMLLPFDCVTKLYESKKDICGGIYFLRNCGYTPCLWMYCEPDKKESYGMFPICMFKENELVKAHNIGMGCVLFKSDIFRKLAEPWFDLQEGKFGQDVFFYRQVLNAGIDVWCDTGVQCEQLSTRTRTSIEDYKKHLLDKTAEAKGFINLQQGGTNT